MSNEGIHMVGDRLVDDETGETLEQGVHPSAADAESGGHIEVIRRLDGEEVNVAAELQKFEEAGYRLLGSLSTDAVQAMVRAARIRRVDTLPGEKFPRYAYGQGFVSDQDGPDGVEWTYLPKTGVAYHWFWVDFQEGVRTDNPAVEQFARSMLEAGITGLRLVFKVGPEDWAFPRKLQGGEWVEDRGGKVKPVLFGSNFEVGGELDTGTLKGYVTFHQPGEAIRDRKRYLRLRGMMRVASSNAEEPEQEGEMAPMDTIVSQF